MSSRGQDSLCWVEEEGPETIRLYYKRFLRIRKLRLATFVTCTITAGENDLGNALLFPGFLYLTNELMVHFFWTSTHAQISENQWFREEHNI